MLKYRRLKIAVGIFIMFSFLSGLLFAEQAKDNNSEIYSKLRDRRCNEPLTNCNCPDAREMKAYIEALMEMGASKDDVFYRVARKFSPNLILDDKIKSQVEQKLVQESGGKMPQAVLEAATFNLGTVSKKQGTIGKVFKLFNRGNDVLVVKNLKTSCPCVTAALKIGKTKSPYFGTTGAPADWQVQINPGKSAEIEAVIDLNHSTVSVGKLIREVYINTNDLLNPEITVKLEAEVTD